jgi:hypothetical protein
VVPRAERIGRGRSGEGGGQGEAGRGRVRAGAALRLRALSRRPTSARLCQRIARNASQHADRHVGLCSTHRPEQRCGSHSRMIIHQVIRRPCI